MPRPSKGHPTPRRACGLLFAVITLAFALQVSAQAVTGTLRDQGGAVFNVKAYGAVGNGTANDNAAVQNTINAAISAGGGIVYFPQGTYLIDKVTTTGATTLTNTRADVVSLVGAGNGSQLSSPQMYPPAWR